AATASYIYALLPQNNKENSFKCDDYVFWDHIHPTAKTHAYLAQKARKLMDDAGLEAIMPEKKPDSPPDI
ncbi:MAG: hypothetical protein PSV35_02630, partial [bacterium]|nr:hypothetical protein [bacterium]